MSLQFHMPFCHLLRWSKPEGPESFNETDLCANKIRRLLYWCDRPLRSRWLNSGLIRVTSGLHGRSSFVFNRYQSRSQRAETTHGGLTLHSELVFITPVHGP